MASLVADYGSDSNTTSEESDESDKFHSTEKGKDINTSEPKKEKLPIPSFFKDGAETNDHTVERVPGSVFSNPYQEAEDSQKSILEKHVKMTNVNKVACLNGKKVCWNYLKGRCHFGRKCRFAHGADVPANAMVDSSKLDAIETPCHETASEDSMQEEEEIERKRKKRPGLPRGLVPSKKAIKCYFRTKPSVEK